MSTAQRAFAFGAPFLFAMAFALAIPDQR